MGKRGPKPKRIISERWSSQLAYAIGLLATDGCLGRRFYQIDLTSKDEEQLKNFSRCIDLHLSVGNKQSGFGGKNVKRVQFKNFYFYNFLLTVGLTPAKSKSLGALKIPRKYFFDFLRGVFDGDGSTYSYWDKRWKSSFMFYVCFASASMEFLQWLQKTAYEHSHVVGHITSARGHSTKQLKYAKADGLKILQRMYRFAVGGTYLRRKRLKIERMLAIVGEQL